MKKRVKGSALLLLAGLVLSGGASAQPVTVEAATDTRIQRALETAEAETRAAQPLTVEAADRWRIQQHLAQVEATLRRTPVPQLSAELRRARERNLELLHAYWIAGRFPRNTGHPGERRPYFIDHEGRACAVAHLLEKTGSLRLAQQVDRRLHNAYVADMDDPELARWAEQSGLSIAELALIQPTYCQCGGSEGAGGADGGADTQAYQPVCGQDGLTYWNECAANLCAQMPVAHAGECEEPARCATCGIGSRLAVVAECAESPGDEILVGVCDRTGGDEVVPVNLLIAERWLELQNASCPTDAAYDGTFPRGEGFGAPWAGIDETWDCGANAGAGGIGGDPPSNAGRGGEAPGNAGAPSDAPNTAGAPASEPNARATRSEDSGCSTSPAGSSPSWPWLACLALGYVRFRRRAHRPLCQSDEAR